MRPERFPEERNSKLAPRGDGPFRVLEKINDNAYKLELPGEFKVSPTFNVSDLAPYIADDEEVLRTEPSQEGGDVVVNQAEEVRLTGLKRWFHQGRPRDDRSRSQTVADPRDVRIKD